MSDTQRLHHLLDRGRRGVLLPAEGEQLAGLVGGLEAENTQLRDWLAHCRHKPRVTELEAEVARLTAGEAALLKVTVDLITSIGYARHTLADNILGQVRAPDDMSLEQIAVAVIAEYRADQSTIRRLAAGQCLDSRRMCEQHHTPPVTGCPYPQCIAARKQQECVHTGANAEDCPACPEPTTA